jgi:hypothetical protein
MPPSIPYENFQEIGPHVKNLPGSHYNAQFHRNFIGLQQLNPVFQSTT